MRQLMMLAELCARSLAALLVSALFFTSAHAQKSATPVQVERVQLAPIVNRIELTGSVTSPHVSQISTSVAGLIQEISLDSGATVEEGQVLVKLDDELEIATLEQLAARTRQARTEVADVERRLEVAERLAKKNYGPQNTVDDRRAELESKRAILASAIAEQKRQTVLLKRHTIKAPFDGIIANRMGEIGEWVEPGNGILELVAMRGLRIDIPVPQKFLTDVKNGVDVSLVFEALSAAAQPANVDAIIPVSDPNARTFTLRVKPAKTNLPIAPGMSARAILKLDAGQEGIVVSRDALIRHPDGRVTIWVFKGDDRQPSVEERRVELGSAHDGVVHVLSGLKDNERIVIRGNEGLRDGQTVRIMN